MSYRKLLSLYSPIHKQAKFSTKSTILNPEDRKKHLEKLVKEGWTHLAERDAIKKRFDFKNFIQAFGFMTQVAMAAEKSNHHPEWSNIFSQVDVVWMTHSCNGLTSKDIKLAKFCDDISRGILNQ